MNPIRFSIFKKFAEPARRTGRTSSVWTGLWRSVVWGSEEEEEEEEEEEDWVLRGRRQREQAKRKQVRFPVKEVDWNAWYGPSMFSLKTL